MKHTVIIEQSYNLRLKKKNGTFCIRSVTKKLLPKKMEEQFRELVCFIKKNNNMIIRRQKEESERHR